MKHGASSRRSRNRGNGGGRRNNGKRNKSRVYDSNGPEVRIRGTAHQVFDKYVALAKDANGAGDYVLAESYLQHAEHYQRMLTGWLDIVDSEKSVEEEERFGLHHGGEEPEDSNQQRSSSRERRTPDKTSQEKQSSEKSSKDEDLGLPPSVTGEKAPDKKRQTKQKQKQNDQELEGA